MGLYLIVVFLSSSFLSLCFVAVGVPSLVALLAAATITSLAAIYFWKDR